MLEKLNEHWNVIVAIVLIVASASVMQYKMELLSKEVDKIDSYQKRQLAWIRDLQMSEKIQDDNIERATKDLDKFSTALDKNTEAVNKLSTLVAVLSEKVK